MPFFVQKVLQNTFNKKINKKHLKFACQTKLTQLNDHSKILTANIVVTNTSALTITIILIPIFYFR